MLLRFQLKDIDRLFLPISQSVYNQILILCITVLCVYYPTISGMPNSLDDYKMLMDFSLREKLDLASFFSPHKGFYYRPVTMLTFAWDKYAWNLEPTFMLFENVIIHLLNTIIVLFLARYIFFKEKNKMLPLFSSLLFAVHPLATESMNWISGRTDPLATFFILLSTLLICIAKDKHQRIYLILGSFIAIFGILSKEMSLFFVPACCILIYWWPTEKTTSVSSRNKSLTDCLIFVSPFMVSAIIFLLYRHIHLAGTENGISTILARIDGHWFDAFLKALTILGFYLKKIFIPVPLCFAITDVNSSYLWLGIAAIPFFFALLRGKKCYLICMATGFLLIAPAIILGTVKIAWTSIAERYVYMATPFFVIGFTGLLSHIFHSEQRKTALSVSLIFLAATSITLHRNIISRDNLSLYQDTVEKNSGFSLIYNELALALMHEGKTKEAEEQLKKGIALIHPEDGNRSQILYANLAYLKLNQGQIAEAEQILNKGMKRVVHKNSKDILWVYTQLIEQKLSNNTINAKNKKNLLTNLINLYKELYEKTGKADYLYLAGKKALTLGKKETAAEYFSKAAVKSADNSAYKLAAQTLASKLKSYP